MMRAEKIGLGVAVTGHIALLGLLSLGFLPPKKPNIGAEDGTIGVTLEGDIPSLNEIPEPVAETELAEPELPEPPPIEELPEPLPDDSAPPPPSDVSKPRSDQAAEQKKKREKEALKRRKAEAKKKREAEAKRKRETENKKKRAADAKKKRESEAKKKRDAEARRKAMEESNRKIRAANAARVKGKVRALIGDQIRPYMRGCKATGPDANRIKLVMRVAINKSGSLSGISTTRKTGINANNRLQVPPLESCITRAIRSASPFKGLDTDYYDVWRSLPLTFKG